MCQIKGDIFNDVESFEVPQGSQNPSTTYSVLLKIGGQKFTNEGTQVQRNPTILWQKYYENG